MDHVCTKTQPSVSTDHVSTKNSTQCLNGPCKYYKLIGGCDNNAMINKYHIHFLNGEIYFQHLVFSFLFTIGTFSPMDGHKLNI